MYPKGSSRESPSLNLSPRGVRMNCTNGLRGGPLIIVYFFWLQMRNVIYLVVSISLIFPIIYPSHSLDFFTKKVFTKKVFTKNFSLEGFH